MSAPRKGKDISALKARLAKRANPAAAPAGPGAPQAPPAQAPAPQPPAQRAPQAEPSYSDLAQTRPAGPQHYPGSAPGGHAAPAARRAGGGDDPFGGGGSFDPNDGLIGGGTGEYKAKSGIGLVAVGGVIGVVGGALIGWVAHTSMGTRSKIEVAKKKAGQMVEEINKVSKARRSLAIEWDDIKKNMATQPAKGASKLKEVMTTHFGKGFAREEQLFGWQLANMGRSTVDSTFSMYRAARELKSDLNDLARFSQSEAGMLNGPPPTAYAVLLRDSQAQLVEFVHPICGDLEAGKPCGARPRAKPTGAAVRLAPGGEVKKLALDKVAILTPRGPYYSTAIAGDPKTNARTRLQKIVRRVDDGLKTMNTAEAAALKGFEKYQLSPEVDQNMPE